MEICPKVDSDAGKVQHTPAMGNGLQDKDKDKEEEEEEEELAENKPHDPYYKLDKKEKQTSSIHGK